MCSGLNFMVLRLGYQICIPKPHRLSLRKKTWADRRGRASSTALHALNYGGSGNYAEPRRTYLCSGHIQGESWFPNRQIPQGSENDPIKLGDAKALLVRSKT